jgi:hypothetical protein
MKKSYEGNWRYKSSWRKTFGKQAYMELVSEICATFYTQPACQSNGFHVRNKYPESIHRLILPGVR